VRLRYVAGLFGFMVLTVAYYFSVFWLAMSLTGGKVAALLLSMAFIFAPLVINPLFYFIGLIYVFGFEAWGGFYLFDDLATITHPILLGHSRYGDGAFISILIYIVLGLAMFAGAFAISRMRKPERTGDAFMFKPVKFVAVFLIILVITIMGGAIAVRVTMLPETLYFGFAAGFIVGFFIAWMIADKTFYVLQRIRLLPHFCAAAAALYALMLFVTHIGMGFYVNRIPPVENVESVSFHRFGSGGTPFTYLSTGFTTDNPEIIAQVQEFHQQILDERGFPNRQLWQFPARGYFGFWPYDWVYEYLEERYDYFVDINYTLTDRQRVLRVYLVSSEFTARTGMDDFFYSDEIIILRCRILRNRDKVDEIQIFIGGTEHRGAPSITITDSERVALLMDDVATGCIADARRLRAGEPPQTHTDIPPELLPYQINFRWRELIGERTHIYIDSLWLDTQDELTHRIAARLEEWGLTPTY
jgi:hypothetical protein